jgi:hypothetical protein
MSLDTIGIEIPRLEARQARDVYREAIRQEGATEADRQLYDAYREVAQGRRVLDIIDVLQKAGVDAQARPKLAICRADAQWGHFYWNDDAFWFAVRRTWTSRNRPRGTVAVPREVFPDHRTRTLGSLQARVPFIPPQYRPKFDLRNYHILWEAEWEKPPVDPLLLRHLRGPFFVVLAAWNLTPLEQAVMRGL